jgi:hypothetical protein
LFLTLHSEAFFAQFSPMPVRSFNNIVDSKNVIAGLTRNPLKTAQSRKQRLSPTFQGGAGAVIISKYLFFLLFDLTEVINLQ